MTSQPPSSSTPHTPMPGMPTASAVAASHDTPRWMETLRDRSQVLIRPINRGDAAEEREFIESLSPSDRRFRFLAQVASPSDALIHALTDVDQVHHVAFAAVVPHDSRERFVGVGRYSVTGDGGCEVALAVSEDWQNRGLGTALMRHLIELARAHGLHHMTSVDSAENLPMNDLARHLGFHSRIDADDASLMVHTLALSEAQPGPGP